MLLSASVDMRYKRCQFKCPDIFCEMQGVRMVRGVRGDCVGIMIDTRDNLGAFLFVKACGIDACRCASGTANKSIYRRLIIDLCAY